MALEKHQNIVRAEWVENIQGNLYIVLEYIANPDMSGADLGRWIRRGLEVPQVLNFAVQFCDGMDYAYKKVDMVHRDIKPGNILVTQDKVVKITDFGLVKTALAEASGEDFLETAGEEAVSDGISFTRTGAVMGTPPYMSPEQCRNAAEVDVRSDIYAFGAVLYEMLTGCWVFEATTSLEFVRCHLSEPAPSPSAVVPGLPRDLEAVVLRCLVKEPAQRYPDFAVLRAELAGIYQTLTGEELALPVAGEALNAQEWSNKGISLSAYLLTVPVLVFPGRGAQYRLLESQFTFDVGQGQRPLAIQNMFPGPSWKPVLDYGGDFRLALNGNLEWGAEVAQITVKRGQSGIKPEEGEHPVKFAQKMQLIQHNLDIGGYSIVTRECVGLVEYALRQGLKQQLPRLKTDDQLRVKELQKKMSERGPLTMGGFLRLLYDSNFFEAWVQATKKDLSSLRLIDLDEVRKLRNAFIHNADREATRTEAEFLLHCVHVIFETFELQQEILPPELGEKPVKIAKLDSHLAGRVGSLNSLSGFMGVTPPFENNLGQLEIDAAFGASTAAWRLDSKGNICNQANMQFVILPKIPKEVRQIKVEAAAHAEPSFKWLTEQVSHVFDRLPQAIQQIIRGRKGLPLQDFQTWTVDLPR